MEMKMSDYPAYPNDHGLGGPVPMHMPVMHQPGAQPSMGMPSQNPTTMPIHMPAPEMPGNDQNWAQIGQSYMSKPFNEQGSNGASMGFNPWSLMGSSNARD